MFLRVFHDQDDGMEWTSVGLVKKRAEGGNVQGRGQDKRCEAALRKRKNGRTFANSEVYLVRSWVASEVHGPRSTASFDEHRPV